MPQSKVQLLLLAIAHVKKPNNSRPLVDADLLTADENGIKKAVRRQRRQEYLGNQYIGSIVSGRMH